MITRNELYHKIYQAVRGVISTKGLSFAVNVFNDNSAICQVNVSMGNMRASLLVSVKENSDGTWSVSDNNTTTTVENVNRIGTVIIRMITRIRTLRSRFS